LPLSFWRKRKTAIDGCDVADVLNLLHCISSALDIGLSFEEHSMDDFWWYAPVFRAAQPCCLGATLLEHHYASWRKLTG
jgi:hypothetical protein